MANLIHHYVTMAYQNAWANHRLLTACEGLSDEDFAAPRTSFFPSLRGTLNHVVTVDWFYVDALERALAGAEPHPDPRSFFTVPEPFATATPLREAQRVVDARLIALTRGLTDEALDTAVVIKRAAGPQSEPVARLLPHLFQHQIHHRGQAHAMLAGTHVAPPPLDEFFCEGEAHLRAADFAALGFTEAEIWGPPGRNAP